jgi:hypothetical protein
MLTGVKCRWVWACLDFVWKVLLQLSLTYLDVVATYIFRGIDCRYDADRCEVQVGLGAHGFLWKVLLLFFLAYLDVVAVLAEG